MRQNRLFFPVAVFSLILLSVSGGSASDRGEGALLVQTPSAFQTAQMTNFPVQQSSRRMSTGSYFLRSLVLPGWGELALGHKKRGITFLLAEGALWGTFAAFKIYGHWREQDYIRFAYERASVKPGSKEQSYFFHVSNYRTIYEYNEEMRRFRRYEDVYPDDDEHFWEWKSDSDRRRFDRLRLSSQLAFRNATLTVGAVLINHLLSAVDAVWMAHRDRSKLAVRAVPRWSQSVWLPSMITLQVKW